MAAHIPAPAALIELWDSGRAQHPIDRALTIVAGCTGTQRSDLAGLTLERRDALLLDVRRALRGDRIDALCACESCGGQNEFGLDARALPAVDEDGAFRVSLGDRSAEVRLPTSYDLASVASVSDPDLAAARLLERCVQAEGPLDDAMRAEIERAMERRGGIAAMRMSFRCVHCDETNAVAFDIAAFVWEELSERARALLVQLDVLASAYGWSEADIFSLGDRRRAIYVELAGQ